MCFFGTEWLPEQEEQKPLSTPSLVEAKEKMHRTASPNKKNHSAPNVSNRKLRDLDLTYKYPELYDLLDNGLVFAKLPRCPGEQNSSMQ